MLFITAIALYFFRRDDIPLETSSLSVLVLLCLVFTVFPFEINGHHLEPSSLFFGFGMLLLTFIQKQPNAKAIAQIP